MEQVESARFFSFKSLIVTIVTVLGLGISLASAASASARSPAHLPSGNDRDLTACRG